MLLVRLFFFTLGLVQIQSLKGFLVSPDPDNLLAHIFFSYSSIRFFFLVPLDITYGSRVIRFMLFG